MQSHRSWQPFNVNAGVKGEVEGFCCSSEFSAKGGLKLIPLRMMIANHHVLITYKVGRISPDLVA